MSRLVPAALLTAAMLLVLAAPVAAEDEPVAVTAMTIDRVVYLSSGSAAVRVSGTIACESTGPADFTSTSATQRQVWGSDNWDLYWFPCAEEPRPFTVVVETFGCDGFDSAGCFRRGRALVEIRGSNDELLASRRVIVRAGTSGERSPGQSKKE